MDGITLELTHPRLIELEQEGAGHAPEQPVRPALFARYGDLARLRYDYPLVLVRNATGGGCVRSLTAIFDGLIREMAPRGAGARRCGGSCCSSKRGSASASSAAPRVR